MRRLWADVRLDWVVALAGAVVVFNLNVTKAGDPLSGLGRSAGPTSPGISDDARTMLYASLVIAGAVLAVAGLMLAAQPLRRGAGTLMSRTYGFVALAGLLGLLLDYRDGPVRTVQLIVYVALVLAVVRFVRLTRIVADPALDPVTTDRA